MLNLSKYLKRAFALLFVIALAFSSLVGCDFDFFEIEKKPVDLNGTTEFHFINVGQGDAILIKSPGGNVLVDAGTTEEKQTVINYLRNENVEDIEYMIITHPHADHIGGATLVLKNFNVKNVIMTDTTTTTKVYETLIETLEQRAELTNVIESVSGNSYEVGDLKFTTFAPNGKYSSNLNNSSIITMFEYGNNKVLIMGDAEIKSEQDTLKKYGTSYFECDLMKIGHHGSTTSSCEEMLDAANPKYAVLTVGAEYDKDHPSQETLDKLDKRNIEYFMTKDGDIVFVSDGNTISKR